MAAMTSTPRTDRQLLQLQLQWTQLVIRDAQTDTGEVGFRNGCAVHELTAQLLRDPTYASQVEPIRVVALDSGETKCYQVIDGVRRIRAFRNAFLTHIVGTTIPVSTQSSDQQSIIDEDELAHAFGTLSVHRGVTNRSASAAVSARPLIPSHRNASDHVAKERAAIAIIWHDIQTEKEETVIRKTTTGNSASTANDGPSASSSSSSSSSLSSARTDLDACRLLLVQCIRSKCGDAADDLLSPDRAIPVSVQDVRLLCPRENHRTGPKEWVLLSQGLLSANLPKWTLVQVHMANKSSASPRPATFLVLVIIGRRKVNGGEMGTICWSWKEEKEEEARIVETANDIHGMQHATVRVLDCIAPWLRMTHHLTQCLRAPSDVIANLLRLPSQGVLLKKRAQPPSTTCNALQDHAIRAFIDSHDTRRWHSVTGPPGSGKTHMIVAALSQLRQHHPTTLRKRVLVCAPSNQALHVLFRSFVDHQPTRLDPCAVLLRSRSFIEKADGVNDESHLAWDASVGMLVRQGTLDTLERVLWLAVAAVSADAAADASTPLALSACVVSIRRHWLHWLEAHPTLPDQAMVLEQIQRNVLPVLEQLAEADVEAKGKGKGEAVLAPSSVLPASSASESTFAFSTACDRGQRTMLLNRVLFAIQCVLRPWARRADVKDAWPRATQFVFSTLGNLLSQSVDSWHSSLGCFDALVIDEAGQGFLGEALYATQLLAQDRSTMTTTAAATPTVGARVWLIGDPCQLGPTQQLLSTSSTTTQAPLPTLFDTVHNLAGRFPRIASHLMLTQQYRMHPAICQWPSQMFYEGNLHAAVALNTNPPKPSPPTYMQAATVDAWLEVNAAEILSAPPPYLFFDVQTAEREQSTSRGSKRNHLEAKALQHVCHWFTMNHPQKRLAVVSFYADQVALLRSLLDARSIVVHTVDSFQGGEADVVLLSFVRHNDRGEAGFVQDARRLNVALTRARKCLWMFGHANTLAHEEAGLLSLLLQDARERETIVTINSCPSDGAPPSPPPQTQKMTTMTQKQKQKKKQKQKQATVEQ